MPADSIIVGRFVAQNACPRLSSRTYHEYVIFNDRLYCLGMSVPNERNSMGLVDWIYPKLKL